jgi:diketogulonate reductase-like aldo/keto reductase
MEYVDVREARIPKLGLGTWMLTGEPCSEVVAEAIRLGYRHIDTAQMYENEAKVGAGIQASGIERDALWITTKLGLDQVAGDRVRPSTHESLRRLGVEYLDLLLIHWPSQTVPLRETLEAMQGLQETGEVRYIGVSNFTPSLLQEALDIAPQILCNQVEYHPFLAQDAIRSLCEMNDLALTSYSPLARGRVAEDPTLKQIGAAHGKSAAQVTLRWLTQQKNVAAIPKASDTTHLRSNLEIFDFELDAEEANRIAGLARGQRLIDPEWAPEWGT